MTERTHDLAGLSMLTIMLVSQPLTMVTVGTIGVAIGASLLGAMIPDLDQPTNHFWHDLPAGSLIGRVIAPLLGGHRLISHSLLGLGMFSWLMHLILIYSHKFLFVDSNIVWWAFVLGYLSHLVMDTITKEGVPWLFPIPIRLGIPPLKVLRIETGGLFEKFLIYPGLMVGNGYLIYLNYHKLADFFSHYLVK